VRDPCRADKIPSQEILSLESEVILCYYLVDFIFLCSLSINNLVDLDA